MSNITRYGLGQKMRQETICRIGLMKTLSMLSKNLAVHFYPLTKVISSPAYCFSIVMVATLLP